MAKSGDIDVLEPQDVVVHEKALTANAEAGFAADKQLGPIAALKVYRPAVLWSLVMAACVIMEGYDTALLGNFFAYRSSHPLT